MSKGPPVGEISALEGCCAEAELNKAAKAKNESIVKERLRKRVEQSKQ